MIRITKRVIQIPISIGLNEDCDLNHYSSDSNQATRKRFEWLLNNRVIRIPPQRIRIQIPVRDILMYWFKSLFKRFESLVKKKWSWEPRIRITHQAIWISHEEQVKRLKHWFESPISWFKSLMKNKTRRFESLSYEFESLHKWSKRLKVGQSDSNHQVTDSNHSMVQNSNIAKVIRIT